MHFDPEKFKALSEIIERYLPETIVDAPPEWSGRFEGLIERRSDVLASNIYTASELGPDLLGASESRIEASELSKALRSSRVGLSKLSSSDRQKLLISVDPGRDQTDCFGRIDELISELQDLERAAQSEQFQRMKGPKTNRNWGWRAAQVAFAANSVWQNARPGDPVRKSVNHDAPSKRFGEFLTEVLGWAGEKSSASVALRSFENWRNSQKSPFS
jgi:hypothetical protein